MEKQNLRILLNVVLMLQLTSFVGCNRPPGRLSFQTKVKIAWNQFPSNAYNTKFSLLDASFPEILKNTDIKVTDSKTGQILTDDQHPLAWFYAYYLAWHEYARANVPPGIGKGNPIFDRMTETESVIKSHTVYATETDENGEGFFDSVRPGTYYVFGAKIFRPGEGIFVWYERVKYEGGTSSIMLDNKSVFQINID